MVALPAASTVTCKGEGGVTVRGLSVPILIGLAMVALILAFLSTLLFVDQQSTLTDVPAGDQYVYGRR
jgi:hypothetical protein